MARLRIASVEQLHRLLRLAAPTHPTVTVVDYAQVSVPTVAIDVDIITGLYVISLKRGLDAALDYGRGSYDFEDGTMIFLAPGQVFSPPSNMEGQSLAGFGIFIHPDFLPGTSLARAMQDYRFFGYDTNEALHLSSAERTTVVGLAELVRTECATASLLQNREVLSATIRLLLEYAQRFYRRQFDTRRGASADLLVQFERNLADYFTQLEAGQSPTADVAYFAADSGLSARYFADLVKRYTGRTVLNHLHERAIDLAKDRLLTTDHTIAEVAYELGFTYPHYFSRLFKARVGMTPKVWRER